MGTGWHPNGGGLKPPVIAGWNNILAAAGHPQGTSVRRQPPPNAPVAEAAPPLPLETSLRFVPGNDYPFFGCGVNRDQ